MLKTLLAVAAFALSAPAHAAEATTPVRAIMDVAVSIWSGEDNDPVDYFDEAHIDNFSVELRALYAEASRHPAYDTDEETGSPFDYDPIISGQDGCPLEDLTIDEGTAIAAGTDVVARFKRFACFEGSSDAERNAVSEVHFQVIEEDGGPVIDDVVTGEGDDRTSLVETLRAIIGG